MAMLCPALPQNCVSSAKWKKLFLKQPSMLYNVKYIENKQFIMKIFSPIEEGIAASKRPH